MQTSGGGNCKVYVQCEQTDSIGVFTGDWNVCYAGGRQYFNQPHIGDFSVTFTKAGGVNGDKQDGYALPMLA